MRKVSGFGWKADSQEPSWHRSRYQPVGKMHKAASAGDMDSLNDLLVSGKTGVNDTDKKNRMALHYACAYGHEEVVVVLIQKKCDINARDSKNSTPLIKASRFQHEKCVDLLLEHEADPNTEDTDGNTALHYAAYHDNTSVAEKLLAQCANIEAKNKIEITQLYFQNI